MATIVYGISNCDAVKQVRAWFVSQGIDAAFHDFRKAGVPQSRLDVWLQAAGWERLLNRRGTAWRKLDDAVRATVVDADSARAVMLAQPSVIKRPVVEWAADIVTVGFEPAAWPPR